MAPPESLSSYRRDACLGESEQTATELQQTSGGGGGPETERDWDKSYDVCFLGSKLYTFHIKKNFII